MAIMMGMATTPMERTVNLTTESMTKLLPKTFHMKAHPSGSPSAKCREQLVVAGQRAGHYLCLFGMHVLTPGILELLEESLGAADDGTPIDLSSSLARLAQSEHYLAFEVDGQRFNTSYRYGLLLAQLAITLGGVDRDLLLTELVSQLARNS